MASDPRNFLFESYVKILEYYRPKFFVFENVKGFLSAKPGGRLVTERIYEAFTNIGYEILNPTLIHTALYNAKDYQVPQNRPRVIILGVKKGSKFKLEELYKALSEEKKNETLTVRDSIGDLPMLLPLKEPIKEGRITRSHNKNTDLTITCHDARNHKERERRVFSDWVRNNMNSASQKEMIEYYFKVTGRKTKYQKYKSLEWNKPAHTIVAHLSKDGYMFIHPDSRQERSITVREAACLQSFPRDFEFVASVPYSYKMIGNAVPVQFAYGIAMGICKILDKT